MYPKVQDDDLHLPLPFVCAGDGVPEYGLPATILSAIAYILAGYYATGAGAIPNCFSGNHYQMISSAAYA
jgi:hypothetical protein